jgi:hypothetical protein
MTSATETTGVRRNESHLERRREMEQKNEVTEGKGKAASYVRWFFVGAFGLIIIFTVIMAVYRKFGG